jgi:hypothetical protein
MSKFISFLTALFCLIMFVGCDIVTNPKQAENKKDPYTRYFTTTFNANGGTDVLPITQEEGSELLLPETTRKGHDFDGWFDGKEKKDIGSIYKVNANTTLSAEWQLAIIGTWYCKKTTEMLIFSDDNNLKAFFIEKGELVGVDMTYIIDNNEIRCFLFEIHHVFDLTYDEIEDVIMLQTITFVRQ